MATLMAILTITVLFFIVPESLSEEIGIWVIWSILYDSGRVGGGGGGL